MFLLPGGELGGRIEIPGNPIGVIQNAMISSFSLNIKYYITTVSNNQYASFVSVLSKIDGINADNPAPLADCNSRSTLNFFDFSILSVHLPLNPLFDLGEGREGGPTPYHTFRCPARGL
jgi:hypothetical protein